jgi:hypothetical protein
METDENAFVRQLSISCFSSSTGNETAGEDPTRSIVCAEFARMEEHRARCAPGFSRTGSEHRASEGDVGMLPLSSAAPRYSRIDCPQSGAR